jgi:cell division protein FtsA
VVLCGGGSRVPGIVTLAEETFGMAVSLGQTSAISGQVTALNQPEFATAIGLVKYGALRRRKPAARLSLWVRITEFVNSLLGFLR